MPDSLPEMPRRRIGFGTRAMAWIASVDAATLSRCPDRDVENVRATGLLFIAVWIYQASVYASVAHKVLASDGQIHPMLIVASLFLATMLLLLDSYVFLRAGYYAEGLKQLRQIAGLQLEGETAARIAAAVALLIRISLVVAQAQLTGIFMGLILFQADIESDAARQFQADNATLIAASREHVANDIKRSAAALENAQAHLKALQTQIVVLRSSAVDPADNDAAIAAAKNEISTLSADKAQRDADLRNTQAHASAELGGDQMDAQNTGVPGRGWKRIAEEERRKDAVSNRDEAAAALAAAKRRYDSLRKEMALESNARAQRAKDELPQLESDLKAAGTDVAALRRELEGKIAGREEAIRAAIDLAPEKVGRDRGILGQLHALERIAKDPEIAAVIILIGIVAFSLEAAAVLAKVTAYVPSTFSAMLVADNYRQVTEVANELEAALNSGYMSGEPGVRSPRSDEADAAKAGGEPEPITERFDPTLGPALDPPVGVPLAGTRPRGRPRKSPPPPAVTSANAPREEAP